MEKYLTEHQLSVSAINELALSGKQFTIAEIEKEIKRRFKLVNMSLVFLVPMRDYINNLADRGLFVRIGHDSVPDIDVPYVASESFIRLAEIIPNCVSDGIKLDELAFRLNNENAKIGDTPL